MVAEAVFVDTNVLVYADLPSSDQHAAAVDALRWLQESKRPLWISSQVLREYLSAITRPQANGTSVSMRDAIVGVASI